MHADVFKTHVCFDDGSHSFNGVLQQEAAQQCGGQSKVPRCEHTHADSDDGDADDYARSTPLDLVSEIPNAIDYGWFMAGRNDREIYQ